MFYVIMAPAFAMLLYMLFHLRALRRHDQVLFRLCDLRREVMAFLREQGDSLSRGDYFAARDILEVLNHTIRNYNERKTTIFHLRRFMAFMHAYRDSARDVSSIARSSHPAIEQLEGKLRSAILWGFLTYTPFLNYELVFKVSLALAKTLAGVGVRKIRFGAKNFLMTLVLVQDQLRAESSPRFVA